jgi:Na+-driven multidrug efflux pump
MLFLVILAVLFYTWAHEFVGLFSPDPRVVASGVQALRIICLGYAFVSYGMVVAHAFNGAGDTRTPLAINIIAYWLLQIPLAYVLAITLNMGPRGVYIAVAVSFSIAAVMSILVFKRGRWKLVKV